VDESDTVSFSGSYTDLGDTSTHTITWEFGDGDFESGTLMPTHIYEDNGIYTVTLTVTDGYGGIGSDSLTVTVNNVAPTIDAGSDQTAECCVDTVSFSGSFYDPSLLDTHTLEWDFGDGTTTTGTLNPSHTYCDIGDYTVTLTVTDDDGGEGAATLTVTVVDIIPPEITLSDDPIVLWPPNHKYHTFEISDFVISVEDICDADVGIDDIVITLVSSDEPENVQGGGDGNTWDDIVILDAQTVKLRVERQGSGNGRVYTINFEVTDASGNTATGFYKISVPHNKKSTAIDDGPDAGYTVYYP